MAKDIYHNLVKEALEKEGWSITDDPLELYNKAEKLDYEIDLGAERLLCAEKGVEKIAVEIKSCLRLSFAHEFHSILGQYLVYLAGLKELGISRSLYLAIPQFAEDKLKDHLFLLRLLNTYQVKLIIFDTQTSEIVSWKN